MSSDPLGRALESDAPPTAAAPQHDVSAEARGWRLALEDAPSAYEMFREQQDVTKVVLKPDWQKEAA